MLCVKEWIYLQHVAQWSTGYEGFRQFQACVHLFELNVRTLSFWSCYVRLTYLSGLKLTAGSRYFVGTLPSSLTTLSPFFAEFTEFTEATNRWNYISVSCSTRPTLIKSFIVEQINATIWQVATHSNNLQLYFINVGAFLCLGALWRLIAWPLTHGQLSN